MTRELLLASTSPGMLKNLPKSSISLKRIYLLILYLCDNIGTQLLSIIYNIQVLNKAVKKGMIH